MKGECGLNLKKAQEQVFILLYQLNQAMASNRSLENNANFMASLANVLNELDNSINMTTYSNQGLVQFALQRIQRYIDNPQLFN